MISDTVGNGDIHYEGTFVEYWTFVEREPR